MTLPEQTGGDYAFGDTPVARERLELVGTVFNPPSRAFLARAVPEPPALAADLGCGPGSTTRLVHEVTGARRTVGLDRSAEFVAAARARAGDGIDFRRWSAGDPLPGGAPDLIYARLLLAHLPRPAGLVAQWAGLLRRGGRLLLDEVDGIETGSEVFAEYLAMTTALVASNGAQMFAGPPLAGLRLGGDAEVTADKVVTLPVAPAVAARMFELNLAVWGDSPWIAAAYGPAAVARIGGELRRIAGGSAAGAITWKMRQIVVRRSPPG